MSLGVGTLAYCLQGAHEGAHSLPRSARPAHAGKYPLPYLLAGHISTLGMLREDDLATSGLFIEFANGDDVLHLIDEVVLL